MSLFPEQQYFQSPVGERLSDAAVRRARPGRHNGGGNRQLQNPPPSRAGQSQAEAERIINRSRHSGRTDGLTDTVERRTDGHTQ